MNTICNTAAEGDISIPFAQVLQVMLEEFFCGLGRLTPGACLSPSIRASRGILRQINGLAQDTTHLKKTA